MTKESTSEAKCWQASVAEADAGRLRKRKRTRAGFGSGSGRDEDSAAGVDSAVPRLREGRRGGGSTTGIGGGVDVEKLDTSTLVFTLG